MPRTGRGFEIDCSRTGRRKRELKQLPRPRLAVSVSIGASNGMGTGLGGDHVAFAARLRNGFRSQRERLGSKSNITNMLIPHACMFLSFKVKVV